MQALACAGQHDAIKRWLGAKHRERSHALETDWKAFLAALQAQMDADAGHPADALHGLPLQYQVTLALLVGDSRVLPGFNTIQAEATAEGVDDWNSVAWAWSRALGSDDDARRCMGRADYLHLARAWKGSWRSDEPRLGSDDDARRCMGQAEVGAKNSDDWCSVASAWKKVLGSEDDARRCMAHAEARAAHFSDWHRVMMGWWDTFGDHDRDWVRWQRQKGWFLLRTGSKAALWGLGSGLVMGWVTWLAPYVGGVGWLALAVGVACGLLVALRLCVD